MRQVCGLSMCLVRGDGCGSVVGLDATGQVGRLWYGYVNLYRPYYLEWELLSRLAKSICTEFEPRDGMVY